MRILIVNKFYYLRGGDCMAAISLKEMLEQKGHVVAVFSMEYPLNWESDWKQYFPSEVDFSSNTIKGKLKAFERLFCSREVKVKLQRLIKDFNPDIIHLHNVHSYLSPLVAQVAYQLNKKVVWTLHDYKLICPSYSCLRDNQVCELCYKNKFNVLKFRCLKHSTVASLLALLEAFFWNQKRLQKYTGCFIAPSMFLKKKMISAGFNTSQIKVIHNAHYLKDKENVNCTDIGNYYCYVGRMSPEKGIDNLVSVASKLPYNLKIIGSGELFDPLKSKYSNCDNIEFLGQLDHDKVIEILRYARFSILPSVCYENNPFSIIESLCVGTPVLGANIGGIPELIEDGVNGILFDPYDKDSLENAIYKGIRQFISTYDRQVIKERALIKFSPDNYYNQLIEIYSILK